MITDALLAPDRALFFLINVDGSNSVLDTICPWLTHLGGKTAGYVFVFAVLVLSRSGWSFFLAALSYAFNAGVFKGVKYTVLRARPFELPGAILRQSPEVSGATDPSFPSGHAAISFMIATFLSCRYPRYSPVFFLLAAIISCTRIYLGLHYPSDVLAGAVIGTLTTMTVMVLGRRYGYANSWIKQK